MSILSSLTPAQPLGWSQARHGLSACLLIAFEGSRFWLRSLPTVYIVDTLPLLRHVTAAQEASANGQRDHDIQIYTSSPLCLHLWPLNAAAPLPSAPPLLWLKASHTQSVKDQTHALPTLPHEPSTNFPKWHQHLLWTSPSPSPFITHPFLKPIHTYPLNITPLHLHCKLCPPTGFLTWTTQQLLLIGAGLLPIFPAYRSPRNFHKQTKMRSYFSFAKNHSLTCYHLPNKDQNGDCGDFPGGTVVKSPPANAGDTGLSPSLGRFHMPWSS